jgi:hypothetical protein
MAVGVSNRERLESAREEEALRVALCLDEHAGYTAHAGGLLGRLQQSRAQTLAG